MGSPTPHHLVIPDWTKIGIVDSRSAGTVICGYGAQRRGTVGRVSGRCTFVHGVVNRADIGIESFDPNGIEQPGSKQISHDGDCGMIYLDEQGNPWCMHHAITCKDNTTYTSWGTRLEAIMDAHYEYFGIPGSAAAAAHQMNNIPAKSPLHNGGTFTAQTFQ